MFDTTNPLRLTRRSSVAGQKRAPIAALPPADGGDHVPDSIGPLWTEWQKLHRQAVELCHEAQNAEAHLLRTVGVPMVRVPTVDGRDGALALSHEEVDKLLAEYGLPVEAGKELHRKLSVLQDRWNAEADRNGYIDASRREGEAWAREAEVASAIFSATATSLVDVQVKAALMIQMCAAEMVDTAFPLPQLQSISTDIEKLISADLQREQGGFSEA